MIALVNAANPPRRLPLGADTVQRIEQKHREVEVETRAMASAGDVDGICGWGQADFLSPFDSTVHGFVRDGRLESSPPDLFEYSTCRKLLSLRI